MDCSRGEPSAEFKQIKEDFLKTADEWKKLFDGNLNDVRNLFYDLFLVLMVFLTWLINVCGFVFNLDFEVALYSRKYLLEDKKPGNLFF